MKKELADYLNKETEKLKAHQRAEQATIKLPEGHKWKEVRAAAASETFFVCNDCGANFIHDMIDGSTHFEAGAGTCDE